MEGKKGIGLIIGLGKPEHGGEADDTEARELAGKALAKAIKAGDGAAIADAFEQLLACCDDSASEDSDESDDSDEE